MTKKSAAQVRRMQQRAAAKGVEYKSTETSSSDGETQKMQLVETVAKQLRDSFQAIESNSEMNAKARRTEKRKVAAIAAEKAGCSVEDLLQMEEEEEDDAPKQQKSQVKLLDSKKKTNPYVLFVGQMAYTTTAPGLLEHFQKGLGNTSGCLKVRLLTDPKKNNRSKGMAFIEANDPEILFECLKLHHTTLDGRRINVERTTGGGSNKRKEKIQKFRKEQQEYMAETVDKIIADYREKGALDEGELDTGVIELSKRHSCAVVEQALEEYVEAKGNRMDNPSAYLTHIITRIAQEGTTVYTKIETNTNVQSSKKVDTSLKKRKDPPSSRPIKATPSSKKSDTTPSSRNNESSDFFKSREIEMPFSKTDRSAKRNKANFSNSSSSDINMPFSNDKEIDLTHVFPSMTRGKRGRGK